MPVLRGRHVLNVSSKLGNLGPGSEGVKEVLSSPFSELLRVHVEEKSNYCLRGGAEITRTYTCGAREQL